VNSCFLIVGICISLHEWSGEVASGYSLDLM